MRARGDTGSQKSTLFVAEDSSGWEGLAGCFLDADGGGSAELISMWVDPAYRGQGIGRRLVEHVLDWARSNGANSVSLWVTESNSPAIELYARCGFRSTGETQSLPSDETLLEQRMVLEV
jgi:GNAT superfamily N-acetyltransferase